MITLPNGWTIELDDSALLFDLSWAPEPALCCTWGIYEQPGARRRKKSGKGGAFQQYPLPERCEDLLPLIRVHIATSDQQGPPEWDGHYIPDLWKSGVLEKASKAALRAYLDSPEIRTWLTERFGLVHAATRHCRELAIIHPYCVLAAASHYRAEGWSVRDHQLKKGLYPSLSLERNGDWRRYLIHATRDEEEEPPMSMYRLIAHANRGDHTWYVLHVLLIDGEGPQRFRPSYRIFEPEAILG